MDNPVLITGAFGFPSFAVRCWLVCKHFFREPKEPFPKTKSPPCHGHGGMFIETLLVLGVGSAQVTAKRLRGSCLCVLVARPRQPRLGCILVKHGVNRLFPSLPGQHGIMMKSGVSRSQVQAIQTVPFSDFDRIKKVATVVQHHRWTMKQVTSSKTLTCAMSQFKPATRTALADALRKAMPQQLYPLSLPSEYAALSHSVFSPQAWAQQEQFKNISVTPYGIADTRLLASGAYMVAGVPLDEVDGDTLEAKIRSLSTGTGKTKFLNNCKQQGNGQPNPSGGFLARHDQAGTLLTIPAGHLLLMTGMYEDEGEGSQGIRWSYLSPALSAGNDALTQAKLMLQTYPALKDEYAPWIQCLEAVQLLL